jgi:hypothetical protein
MIHVFQVQLLLGVLSSDLLHTEPAMFSHQAALEPDPGDDPGAGDTDESGTDEGDTGESGAADSAANEPPQDPPAPETKPAPASPTRDPQNTPTGGATAAVANPYDPAAERTDFSEKGDALVASFSTKSWCADQLTICWINPKVGEGKRARRVFGWVLSGVRFKLEPGTVSIVQGKRRNPDKFRFDEKSILKSPLIGFELNLVQAWVAFSVAFVVPFKTQADEKSDGNTYQKDPGTFNVDAGYMLGVSAFDGMLVLGGGQLFFDERFFKTDADLADQGISRPSMDPGFFYIGLQPLSAVRKLLKVTSK